MALSNDDPLMGNNIGNPKYLISTEEGSLSIRLSFVKVQSDIPIFYIYIVKTTNITIQDSIFIGSLNSACIYSYESDSVFINNSS